MIKTSPDGFEGLGMDGEDGGFAAPHNCSDTIQLCPVQVPLVLSKFKVLPCGGIEVIMSF